MQHLTRFVLVSSAVCAALFGGCATEEIPQYGDPANLVGSAGATAGSSSGDTSSSGAGSSSGMCVPPDAGCTVSFATDILPILDMKAKCSDGGCHAPGAGQPPELMAGNASATRQALLDHQLLGKPYIVPCDPMASRMPCNMKLGAMTGLNTFGDCSPRMPKVSATDMVADEYLTQTEVDMIAEWITCGAPDN